MQSDAEHDASPFNMDEGSSNSARTCMIIELIGCYLRYRGVFPSFPPPPWPLALVPKNNTAVALIVDFVAVRSGQQNFIAAEAELP